MSYFTLRLIRPIGKISPAREDRDRPETTLADLAYFPRSRTTADLAGRLLATLSREPALAKAWASLLTCFLWAWTWTGFGAGGGGRLLSKRLSGTRATACIIVELAYASLPALSRVSNIVRVGNRSKMVVLYPAALHTGLLMKSSCISCLKPDNASTSSMLPIWLAPSIKVCRCFDVTRCLRSDPGIWLKTMSSRIRAGNVGKLSKDTIPQSLRVSICRYLNFSSSARIEGVKYPPKRTETMSITNTRCAGVPSTWFWIAEISLWLREFYAKGGASFATMLELSPNIISLYEQQTGN